ncbi:S-layer homology domain-containing protein [Schnuerera sp. xch1]|uniref:S-layer homology domain-containing protein n=1 Tax=Schnuerera sp. xch1 TaxID=2874283 RepID=UPI001CBB5945|nr:S-layer homology domain-containing protein [Schnuerera sp. xch1]MBZ2175121.1 S-layer homology domain-containing protein [Schnuerera sp. xch1]
MKKITLLLILILLLTSAPSIAINIPGYEGGIQNENTYKEVIFITGKPIVMEGTLDIKVKERDNTITETYRYELANLLEEAELDRTIKVTATLTPNGNQITSTRTLDSFKETIDIGDTRYQSKDEDYQWNQSTVTHQRPILGYFAGDVLARKTYTIDREETNTVTVETRGKSVGYESPWSSTETQTIDYVIQYEDRLNTEDNWQGVATVETSYNMTKDYSYEENVPIQTSFRGGQNIVERHENVLKYSYDLPRLDGNAVLIGRNIGQDSFSMNTVPVPERLSIPASKDIIGHQWEEELFLLASMDALPIDSTYIGPNTPMSRGDFARAIVQSMDIPIEKQEEEQSSRRRRRREEEPEPPIFKDVDRDHRNFDYIEIAAKKGIMEGIDKGYFYPNESITRAEAYTTLMRLLGLENLAPINKNYTTGYKDDVSIPNWAKDYVYVAKELGMTEEGDYFYPNRLITKGEVSKLIVDLINYMQKDLRSDYRENLLNN